MTALPSSRKTHSERHKQILKQLLKEPANKVCVDCKTATHPRWASWNLGCFMCIRCSGIHRLMGTHISRVKSVDLDAWTDEQVELMVKWGNAKCNLYWEAKLPENYVPDGLKIENFIRTKYDMKKWALSPHVPDPMTVTVGASTSSGITTEPKPAAKSTHREGVKPQTAPRSHVNANANAAKAVSAPSLLDDDFGAFTTSPLPSPTPGVVSASSTGGAHTNTSPAPAPGNTGRVTSERRDLKKSILSLYSLPSSSLASFHNGQNAQSGMAAGYNNSPNPNSPMVLPNGAYNGQNGAKPATDVSSMTDSLLGLSFGQPASPQPSSAAQVNQKWKNEWNDSSSSVNNWSMGNSTSSINSPLGNSFAGAQSPSNYTTRPKNGLDDDLYKNVWS